MEVRASRLKAETQVQSSSLRSIDHSHGEESSHSCAASRYTQSPQQSNTICTFLHPTPKCPTSCFLKCCTNFLCGIPLTRSRTVHIAVVSLSCAGATTQRMVREAACKAIPCSPRHSNNVALATTPRSSHRRLISRIFQCSCSRRLDLQLSQRRPHLSRQPQ